MGLPQLQTITSYSLLSSTIRIADFVKQAKELGYTALGITDINVLYGAVEFYEACHQAGIKPLIGLTLRYKAIETNQAAELILYAKNLNGYQNLMNISSKAMIKADLLTLEDIKSYFADLFVVMPIDKGELTLAALNEEDQQWKKTLEQLYNYFSKDSFFISPSFTCNLKTHPMVFKALAEVKQEFIALQEVRYLEESEGFALKVLENIHSGEQLSNDEWKNDQNGVHFLRSKRQAKETLLEISNQQAIDNAQRIAQECFVEIPLHQKLLPHYPVPNDEPAADFLKRLCYEQLVKRVPNYTKAYQDRLEKELTIIHKMGFDDYFLIVWDVMAFAHKNHVVTGAGRGSAAGSLVSYVLFITDVDPIKYDLLFERFLNPERHSMPDIDLDIPDDKREMILAYIRDKYGAYHMAQIATFGTMAAKMVLRDVARVFGLSQSESNRWSNAVPNKLKMTLKQAYQESAKLVELVNSSKTNRLLFETALTLEGLPRHVSTHAAGVVISDENLRQFIPLQEGSHGIFLTQFTMNDVEKIGLLKMDFLGLRNLSIIADTLKTIAQTQNIHLQLNDIPLDDEKTMALFQRGETSGVFQFESAGIRNVLRKLQPTTIEDIAAVNALYRPGPMQNIDLFIRRKKGVEKIHYPVSDLADILKHTYGVIVYQEQIMQIAAKMAGFSLGQADILRRAISKKKKEVLDEERNHFVVGALKQGYQKESANQIYDYIERFADYGFNRSHAFAYSFIGFQMAYLKVHYPAAFYAAALHSVRHNPKKIKEYVNEAKKNNVTILPPSINESHYSFYLKNKQEILFGFSSLKGVRRDFIAAILEERKSGKYRSFDQFLLRLPKKWLKPENILPLIAIGTFDALEPNRKKLTEDVGNIIQNIVISGGSEDIFEELKLTNKEVQDYPLAEKLAKEEEVLGVYLSGHPTEKFEKIHRLKQVVSLADSVENQDVHLLIYVKNVRIIRTKKGEQMAFVEGDDVSGSISLTLFPRVFRSLRQTIKENEVYYVEGKIERSSYNQELQVLVQKIELAVETEQTISDKKCFLKITPEKNQERNLQLVQNLIQENKGSIPVVLYFEETKQKRVLGSENWIKESAKLREQLQGILGKENVVFK